MAKTKQGNEETERRSLYNFLLIHVHVHVCAIAYDLCIVQWNTGHYQLHVLTTNYKHANMVTCNVLVGLHVQLLLWTCQLQSEKTKFDSTVGTARLNLQFVYTCEKTFVHFTRVTYVHKFPICCYTMYIYHVIYIQCGTCILSASLDMHFISWCYMYSQAPTIYYTIINAPQFRQSYWLKGGHMTMFTRYWTADTLSELRL